MHSLCCDAEVKEYFLEGERLVPLHEEAGRVLGEQAAVPHDPHHVSVPRLLDVVSRDDDAHTWTKNVNLYFCRKGWFGKNSFVCLIMTRLHKILTIIIPLKYWFWLEEV